jgi:hypothetical protein
MPVSSPETVRHQQDSELVEPSRPSDEPRNFDAPSHEPAAPHEAHAGFDAELNPIDDEGINTHGSER